MCNKSTSAGTSLEGTTMFAQVTLHHTFNPLGSKCPWWQDEEAASLRTITFLIIHRFLSLKVLLLSYLLFKKYCTQYISIWKIVLDLMRISGWDKIWKFLRKMLTSWNCSLRKKIDGFYSRSWLREISNLEKHPILRTYTVFKEKLCLENYMSCISMKNINVLLLVFGLVPTDVVLN